MRLVVDLVASLVSPAFGRCSMWSFILWGYLLDDGNYVYQFDALNRVVQVNEHGTATFDEKGRISGGTIGNLVFRYTYDGLGRLICKAGPNSPTDPRTRYEEYYYDGVRRIQEVVWSPVGQYSGGGGGGAGTALSRQFGAGG